MAIVNESGERYYSESPLPPPFSRPVIPLPNTHQAQIAELKEFQLAALKDKDNSMVSSALAAAASANGISVSDDGGLGGGGALVGYMTEQLAKIESAKVTWFYTLNICRAI